MNNEIKPRVAIEFINVNFGYTNAVLNLDNVSFSINENEYVCIVGHNGSGKSTLSKVLTGLLQPKSGFIKIFDQSINKDNVRHLRNNIGIIFQNPDNQFIGLTVEDDIAFGLENRKVTPERMQGIIDAVAQIVEIQPQLRLEPQKLSGGQKQRVAIASILAMNPKIIVFDESTSMLDPKGKREIKELMLVLKNDFNKTVISITHDMDEVLNADKVMVMKNGQLVKVGTPHDVFADEEYLKSISLDVPFPLQLISRLQESGLKKLKPCITIENIAEQIWNLKK